MHSLHDNNNRDLDEILISTYLRTRNITKPPPTVIGPARELTTNNFSLPLPTIINDHQKLFKKILDFQYNTKNIRLFIYSYF